jgi:predicted  nucleic acid-binding Zn-ribbon protein
MLRMARSMPARAAKPFTLGVVMEADLTTQVLRDIRDSIDNLRSDIDNVRGDIARLDTKIDQVEGRLGRRLDQTNRQLVALEDRMSVEISALRADIHALREHAQ